MFTILLRHEGSMAFMESVLESDEARALAQTWSTYTGHDLIVIRDGEDVPRCVYRGGNQVLCRCPDAPAVQPQFAAP